MPWERSVIGLKTDVRGAFGGADNPMVLGALKFRVAGSLEEVEGMLVEECDCDYGKWNGNNEM